MSFNVDECFNKLKEEDSDKRYVGALDLVNALTKKPGRDPAKLDTAAETKLVDKLLDMVAFDGSSGVRGHAAKALGLIARTAQETNLKNMVEKLPAHLEKDKHQVKGQEITGEVRESVAACLKAVIESVPDTQTSIVDACRDKLAPRLVAMAKKTDGDLVSKALDLLADLLSKWGPQFSKKDALLADTQKAALPQLKSTFWACRNRSSACLASLSVYSSDALFSEMIKTLSTNLADVESLPEHTLSYIQAITVICRSVGARFGPQLEHFIPTLQAIVGDVNYDEENSEVRVAAIQSFEAFILRCPKHSEAYLNEIEEIGVTYMSYDPNFVEEEEVEEDEVEEPAADDESNDADDGFGADGDGGGCPWKSAATHCLAEIINTRPGRLLHIYDTVVEALIKGFKEDDDAVRLQVFNTFSVLLRQTQIVTGGDATAPAAKKLSEFTTIFVKAIAKELKGKSLKTRPAAFKVLSLYVKVLPGSLESHLAELSPGLKTAVSGKSSSSALKADALAFLGALLATHGSKQVQGLLNDLAPSVYSAFKDSSAPTAAAALQAAGEIGRVAPDSFDFAALYKATFDRLGDRDAHAEIQDAAIDAMASVISTAGDKLGDAVPKALSVLAQRLGSDLTRLAAIKAFDKIAKSSKKVDCKAVVGDVFVHVTKFLPLENRQLKMASLNILPTLVQKYGKEKAAAAQFEKLVQELVGLLGDNSVVGFAIQGIAEILAVDPKSTTKSVKDLVLPRVQDLLKSSTIQGFALESVTVLYKAMAASESKDLSSDKLLKGLTDIGATAGLSHQSYKAVAQCVGALASASDSGEIVKKFLGEIGGKTKDHAQEFALYSLGEIGHRVDLSSNASVKDKVLAAFDAESTDIRAAASIALGNIAAGNLEKYLPDILAEMKNTNRQYLLLASLREAIVTTSSDRIATYAEKLLAILFQHTAAEQEGSRAVVSECLGKLALTNPATVVAALAEKTQDKSGNTRATVAASVRFAVSEAAHPIDNVLAKHIAAFLALISDPEVTVRKQALLSLDLIARAKPKLIRSHLPTAQVALYKQTAIIKELIEERVVGPFKHIIDHGLGARQAAYSAMYQLLDTCLDVLDLPAFIEPLAGGLKEDDADVKLLNYMILIRLSQRAPSALVAGLDKLAPVLKATMIAKPRDAKFSADVEGNNKMVLATLRCIAFIARIPDATTVPAWAALVTDIGTATTIDTVQPPDAKDPKASPILPKYEKIVKELDD